MIAEKENKPFIATTPGVVLACLASCFLWGSAFPCVKIGYELFAIDAADVPSILVFAGTRFVIAGLMVAAGMSVAQRRAFVPARRDLPYVGALAVFQTILQYILFYVGLANCAGVTSSILEASNSFLCVLLAALVFRFERLTGRKVLGCVIGFAGVVLVNVAGEGGGLNFTLAGEGMVLASTVAAATSSNLAKLFSRDHDPVLLSGWQFVLGGAVLLAVGLALGRARASRLPGLHFRGRLLAVVARAGREPRLARRGVRIHEPSLWRAALRRSSRRDQRGESRDRRGRTRAGERGHRNR